MKWRGEFLLNGAVFHNEILSTGLTFLGSVLCNDSADEFGSIRLENAAQDEIITKSLSSCGYAVVGDVLTITSTAEFTAGEVTDQAEYAVLVSTLGVDIARAPILAGYNQAVIVTRRDIFEVNA